VLVDDLSDYAHEKLETAEDGGTRRLVIEMLVLTEAMMEDPGRLLNLNAPGPVSHFLCSPRASERARREMQAYRVRSCPCPL
jgi:hypothetical protein